MTTPTLAQPLAPLDHPAFTRLWECETTGCPNPWGYHDELGVKRCEPCMDAGWPGCMPSREEDLPATELYDGNYTALFAELDRRHGVVATAEIVDASETGEIPVVRVSSGFGGLEPQQTAAMERFNAAHDEDSTEEDTTGWTE